MELLRNIFQKVEGYTLGEHFIAQDQVAHIIMNYVTVMLEGFFVL